ncbi:hypothetical protein EJB05_46172, partial [Eragrostis curvula]
MEEQQRGHQEGARKDVERAFGVLQAHFGILRNPARMWQVKSLADIMYACIILHNMIVEDERDSYRVRYDRDYKEYDKEYDQGSDPTPLLGYGHGPVHGFSRLLRIDEDIRDRDMHRRLKDDLVEHIWQKFGGASSSQGGNQA